MVLILVLVAATAVKAVMEEGILVRLLAAAARVAAVPRAILAATTQERPGVTRVAPLPGVA